MLIKKHLFAFILLLITSFTVHAQKNTYSVTGRVIDIKKKNIELGNAIALSTSDTALITGEVFMDGIFKLQGLNSKTFLLKLSSLGLKDTLISVVHKEQDSIIDVGTIIMCNNNTLKEVSVSSKVPLFENDGEKIKLNVESTSLSVAGSALDILRKSPGVLVSSSNNVSVFGKGAALIYLDGQLIASMEVLNTLPSNDIKSIEIINNPSSKYDAAGRAVINIITKRNIQKGYNGSTWMNIFYSKYFVTQSGISLNLKNNKHALNLVYATRLGTIWSSDDYIRNFKSNDTTLITMNNHIYETHKIDNQQYTRLGYTYSIDSNKFISVKYNGLYDRRLTSTNNENRISQNNQDAYALKTISKSHPQMINQAASINFSDKLDTLGSELFAAFQYTNFYSGSIIHIYQDYAKLGNTVFQEKQNRNTNTISIYTAQTDFDKVFSKTWKLSSGIKDSYTFRDGEVKFDKYSSFSNEWIPDPYYYNGFSYKENVLAAYSELKFKRKKFSARAGLRAEQTHSDGFSKKLNQRIIFLNYFNLFPNSFVGYDFTKDLTTTLTYSNRITRPAFQDMDPFINYIDSLSSFQGNPLLKPEFNTSIEGSLIYKKEASLTFGYSRTNGALNTVIDKLNDGSDAFIVSTKNLDRSESYSAGITIPYELSWWTTSNYVGYFMNTFTYKSNNSFVKNSKPLLYIYLYDEFRWKKIVSLEITYMYTSATVDGIFITKPNSNLSATLKKTFFKDQLTCRLSANDILKTYVTSGRSNIPGYDAQFVSKTNSHYFFLAIVYKFGKLKVNNANKQIGREETDRIKTGK